MPRYYFDLITSEGITTDEQGQVMSGLDAMRREALQVLPDVARDELPDGDRDVFAIRVRDETGRYIFEATLSLKADWLD